MYNMKRVLPIVIRKGVLLCMAFLLAMSMIACSKKQTAEGGKAGQSQTAGKENGKTEGKTKDQGTASKSDSTAGQSGKSQKADDCAR